MASGAPWGTRPPIANPGWNALPGRTMGGGCQGNRKDVEYAQAPPPSWKVVTMVVLVQRAYFSALRMVFEVPSVTWAKLTFPWVTSLGALVGSRVASRALPA